MNDFDPECERWFERRKHLLDPRMAELVLDLSRDDTDEAASIYMVPLFEDPQKTTAWEVGAAERLLAYECLAKHIKPFISEKWGIVEYRRKGDHTVPFAQLVTDSGQASAHLPEAISNLTRGLRDASTAISDLPISIRSRMIGLMGVLDWYMTCGKPLPHWSIAEQAMIGTPSGIWTWEHLHISAQIQAYLYSLRIVKQMLDYTDALTANVGSAAPLADLAEALQSLPPLVTLMPSRGELYASAASLDRAALQATLDGFLQRRGIPPFQGSKQQASVTGQPGKAARPKPEGRGKSGKTRVKLTGLPSTGRFATLVAETDA